MKTQLVKRLWNKYFLPDLPGFNIKGHLVYHQNLYDILRGFYFESSAFSGNTFTIEVFVQPLYVPNESVIFTFGDRLGFITKQKDIWWNFDESREYEISQEILSMMIGSGLPFLEERESVKKFLQCYQNIDVNANKHRVEAIGYSYIMNNEYAKATNLLSSLNDILSQDIQKHPEITWMKNLQCRVQMILGYLQHQEYASAEQQLNEWKSYTLSNLNLFENKSTCKFTKQ